MVLDLVLFRIRQGRRVIFALALRTSVRAPGECTPEARERDGPVGPREKGAVLMRPGEDVAPIMPPSAVVRSGQCQHGSPDHRFSVQSLSHPDRAVRGHRARSGSGNVPRRHRHVPGTSAGQRQSEQKSQKACHQLDFDRRVESQKAEHEETGGMTTAKASGFSERAPASQDDEGHHGRRLNQELGITGTSPTPGVASPVCRLVRIRACL